MYNETIVLIMNNLLKKKDESLLVCTCQIFYIVKIVRRCFSKVDYFHFVLCFHLLFASYTNIYKNLLLSLPYVPTMKNQHFFNWYGIFANGYYMGNDFPHHLH